VKMATQDKPKGQARFEDEYASFLREYAAGSGEAALGKAYELGRQALAEGKSLVEIASVHHKTLQGLLREEKDGEVRESLLQTNGDFLAECLSPYEMAHRGFQDAVKALRQLNETLEEEIKRIAYAVHDEAGQLLVAVHLALAEVARELPPVQQAKIGQIEGLLNQVEKHLRRYSHELRPTILDDLGWIPAIHFLAEGVSSRAGLPIHIEATVSGRLPGAVETALYRTVQEGLNNAVKHAKAKNVWIRAWKERDALCCSIRDDGAGFDPIHVQGESSHRGLGLIAMRERMSAIGGTLRVESWPGRGTELSVRVSLEVGHANTRRARG
jgi:two-component system, NarL family, sensor histidine kinase UhpB